MQRVVGNHMNRKFMSWNLLTLLVVLGAGVVLGRFAMQFNSPIILSGQNTISTVPVEADEPRLKYFAEQMSGLIKIFRTPSFQIECSEVNGSYSIMSLEDNCVIVSELHELDTDLSKVITRTYVFNEGKNRIMCAFTRNTATRQLIRCYYGFNDQITYIDRNGDGIWDISPVNTDKLNVGSELPVKDQPNYSPISPSKSESNSEK
ncbi:hypothetical protein FACS1894170_10070 [Planctomycetales bacterium]|nr:hypothetical protein FACS1894170_10070 [Planctomycetales bacterium]